VLAPRAAAVARELGAAEVVRSLPKPIPDPGPDGSPRTQQPLQAEQPQDDQPQQQQQQQQKGIRNAGPQR
jgi:hypothetical protein